MEDFICKLKFIIAIIAIALIFSCNPEENPNHKLSDKINTSPVDTSLIDTFQIIDELSDELITFSDASTGPIFYSKNYGIEIYRTFLHKEQATIKSDYDILFSITNFGKEKVLMPLSITGGFFPEIHSKSLNQVYFYRKGSITLRASKQGKIEYDLDFCVLGNLFSNKTWINEDKKRIDKEIVEAIQQIKANSPAEESITISLETKQKGNLTPKCFYCKKVTVSNEGNSYFFKEHDIERTPLLENEELKIVEKGNILDTLRIDEKALNQRTRDYQKILDLKDL